MKLNAGLDGRLTLVSAPAGFGKTTLVSDWLNQLPSSHNKWRTEHCTWLSLDQNDNETVRFLQYLITAIQVVYPKLGIEILATLENSPKPNTQNIMQDLLNEIMVKDQQLLLILDDFHEIQNNQIHQIMQAMVDFLPPKTHIIITTRQDPPMSGARTICCRVDQQRIRS